MGSALCLIRPVPVLAAVHDFDQSGNKSVKDDLVAGDSYVIKENVSINLNIDDTKTIDEIELKEGSTLTITGSLGKELTVGRICFELTSGQVGKVIINSGTIKASNIIAKDIVINGGNVTVETDHYGSGIEGTNSLEINGGNVKTTAKTSGLSGNYINITGGNIDVSGVDTTRSSSGINGRENITISGGTVTAQGDQYGISSLGSLTVNGSKTVVRAKSNNGINSVAVQANNSITIGDRFKITKPAGGFIRHIYIPDEQKDYYIIVKSNNDKAFDVEIRPTDDGRDEEEPSKPAVVNPDTVEGYFALNGQPIPGVAMGKTKQGVAAQAVFNAIRQAGWQESFTFNMAINGKVDYTLKNGVLTIIIPKEYRKAGRTFAIMALDKNGKAWAFADTDTNPATLTVKIYVEGYAFALIYKD